MANYVDYEYEMEVYNPETDEYDYPTINVEVAVYRERDYDGHLYTTGHVHSVEEGYELSKSDEEYIVDTVLANYCEG